ncbi:MAG: helix-turn-helix transcriptional regulator [Bdellovibrionota bacterium]
MSRINLMLGELAREYRLKANMTQQELAMKLGYESVQFVSLFERGLSKIPVRILGKLIIILGIPEKKITKHLMDVFSTDLNEKISEGKRSVS